MATYLYIYILLSKNAIFLLSMWTNNVERYIFHRGLFSRKSKEEEEDQGWKLFGRVPPKQGVAKPPQQISQEFQQRNALVNTNRTKKSDIEVMSTTALILENRPQ